MERRNFFKSIFGAGVVLAVAPQTLLNTEQPIVEAIKEAPKKLAGSEFKAIQKVVATLKRDGEIVAYCAGEVTISESVEMIEVSEMEDVMQHRPPRYIQGVRTTMLTMPNIIPFNRDIRALDLCDAYEFTMENEEFRLYADNVYIQNMEMMQDFNSPIIFTASLSLQGKLTIKQLK